MEALYGAGWEDRPEVVAQYHKLCSSQRFQLQIFIDQGLYVATELLGVEWINTMIEEGKITPHGRLI